MKEKSIETMLSQKSEQVLDQQRRRQEEARLKNEQALQRAKINESRVLENRHNSILQRRRREQEQEQKLINDRLQQSQDRMKLAAER